MKEFAKLGYLLKNSRLKKNFTQNQLAKKLKISSQYISNWERGKCAPPSKLLHIVIDVLDLRKNELTEAMLKDAELEIRRKVMQHK